MTPDEELLFLAEEEVRLSDLLAKGQDQELEMCAKLRGAERKLESSRSYVRLLEDNYRTMKSAPVVTLAGFKQTSEALGIQRSAVSHYVRETSTLRERIAKIEKDVDDIESHLEDVFEQRASFGRVYLFRRPDL